MSESIGIVASNGPLVAAPDNDADECLALDGMVTGRETLAVGGVS